MASFIPSYFQKRLLRYALTRLDFIETDDLALEDLDITFGQTSVAELKNVGIKVAKLIEKLQLPPTLVLDHAIIRRLRITVPANLYTNGIVVEVDGVDIQVELREAETNTKSRSGISQKYATNRSGAPSSLRYGSRGSQNEQSDISDIGHVLPTSHDLAMSFLETEPRQEREELEAAIQSRSQYVQESTASLDSSVDELGTGMPGGFSLPGFVANFFAGVADRLTVTILNIAIEVGMTLSSPGVSSDTVKAVIRVAKLSLDNLDHNPASDTRSSSQRRISLTNLEVLLLSEPETFCHSSAMSSPRLLKSRSKVSSSLSSNSMRQFDSPESRLSDIDFQPTLLEESAHGIRDLNTTSSQASSSSFASRLAHPSMDDNRSDSDDAQMPYNHPGSISRSSAFRNVDTLSMSASLEDQDGVINTNDGGLNVAIGHGSRTPSDAGSEDLTQSRMYTHEQAESMYLSAMSETPNARMPGGWESSDYKAANDDEFPPRQQIHNEESPLFEVSRSQAVSHARSRTGLSSLHESSDLSHSTTSGLEQKPAGSRAAASTLVAKRLAFIDNMRIAFSVPDSGDQEDDIEPSQNTLLQPHPDMQSTYLKQPIVKDHLADRIAHGIEPQSPSHLPQTKLQKNRYELSLGSISVSLDMSIGKMLIRTATAVQKVFSTVGANSSKSQSQDDLSISVEFRTLDLDICQTVPEVSQYSSQSIVDAEAYRGYIAKESMLRLSLSKFEYQLIQSSANSRQIIRVQKVVLGQGDERFMYFVDTINVRDSVATSMMLKPDDLVINVSNDRYDVQLKPVHITVDLLAVDDILSRGGGLSSLLDLGNSALSTGTIKEKSSTVSKPIVRPRTVRFDDSSTAGKTDEQQRPSSPKIDVRIAGIFLNLAGSETSIQLRTSAVKLVFRQKLFRAQIDVAALIGPITKTTKERADINVKLTKLSLIYLDTPAEDDLDRLLSLLTPSNDRYDEEDDIMVDTLIRQRRKGGVMRFEAGDINVSVKGLEWQKHITTLSDELARLSAVSRYLPEDDRPGVLTFGLINKLILNAEVEPEFGVLNLRADLLEAAHISVPSLTAAQLTSLSLKRNEAALINQVIPDVETLTPLSPPMLRCRFIADEMDPTVRIKLSNTQLEYSVPTIVAIIHLAESLKQEQANATDGLSPRSSEISSSHSDASDFARKVRVSLVIRNSSVALNPDKTPARGLILLSDVTFGTGNRKKTTVTQLDLHKASILIIDDAGKIGHDHSNIDQKRFFEQNIQVHDLIEAGYVPVASISKASAVVKLTNDDLSDQPLIDVEFRNDLCVLETCADSTQTLAQILSGLAPPSVPSTQAKYRTEIVPIQDMLSSFTGDAFVSEPGPELGMHASYMTEAGYTVTSEGGDHGTAQDEEVYSDENESYDEEDEEHYRSEMTDSYVESELSRSKLSDSVHIAPVELTADSESSGEESIMAHSMLDFRNEHFATKPGAANLPRHWNSARNAFASDEADSAPRLPFRLKVCDVHIIWNLFDGYDWQSTREVISQAVQDIEAKTVMKRARRDAHLSKQDDDESIVGDFLFNSIYVGIPANKDPRSLTDAINQDLGDGISETGSYATGTTITAIPSNRSAAVHSKRKKLRLDRSKRHKLTLELKGVSADILALPSGSGEVEHSIDVRVNMLEVFDNIPTSTWNKFATYMHEAGEREVNTNMVHLELLNVRPVADLAAFELVAKLSVLPLSLHIDQDALDFIDRFFSFKDGKAAPSPSGPAPFFQRVEVNPVKLKLDFKPKRVDYGALRAGRTTELMNFIVLDRTDILLRRVILYGVSGLDRVGIMLNDIWSPDVKKNQLPGVLAGLAPIRSLVDVGSGIRDLVAVPIREYKKDGRIVRSIQKGALAFAKTTTTELVNLGAKLAIGTQTVLQNAEEVLVPRPKPDDDDDDEPKEQISLYADQPLGIVQGLRGAYASLERDLLLAKDAIVAVPGEVMASGSAQGAAKAVLRQTPIIILRPAIGATKAVGQTLLGAGNTLDKGKMRRVEEKYKRRF